jgi:hypothetical protein
VGFVEFMLIAALRLRDSDDGPTGAASFGLAAQLLPETREDFVSVRLMRLQGMCFSRRESPRQASII